MPRPEMLEDIAEEQGTYVVNCSFKDEDGEDVIPTSIKWTLTTVGGEVVNERSDVSVASPAASVDLVLSGADLQLLSHKESFSSRILTIKALYNSSLGNGLPLNKAVRFKVRNLRLVAQTLEVSVTDMIFIGEYHQGGLT